MEENGAGLLISFGPYRLDRARGCLWRGEQIVTLRRKSWETLLYLADRPGTLVTNEALHNAVWRGVAITPKTLTNVIAEIRRALGDNPEAPLYIETVHRRGYRFLPTVASSPAPVDERVDSDFIGRADELRAIREVWQQVLRGSRQTVFLCGEAGIGKSTLIDRALSTLAAGSEAPLVGRGQCIERHGAHEAYMPVLEAIASWAGEEPATVTSLLREFAPTWLAQIPWLIPESDRSALNANLLAGSAARMLREGTRFLEALAERHPLVLALEDLHWSDPETIDYLAAAGRSRGGRILLIGTYRPVEARISAHPVVSAANALIRSGALQLVVEPFTREDVTAYLCRRLDDPDVSLQAAGVVEEHSRGIPLLVRAVVDHMISQSHQTADGRGWRLPRDPRVLLADLPNSVRDVIDVQVERLQPADLELLEIAAVVGQQFHIDTVAAGLAMPVEKVEDDLSRLSRQSRLIEECRIDAPPTFSGGGRRYGFVHTLYHMALYERLPQYKRQRLHQRIGEHLEASGAGGNAAELASHFERSGDHARAATYFERAAFSVSSRAASREAVAYLRQALEQLEQLPYDGTRSLHELRLQAQLGEAAASAFGADSPVVKESAVRALDLCSRVQEPRTLFGALHALWLYTLLNGDGRVGGNLVMHTTLLATQTSDPLLTLLSDVMVGTVACFSGWPAQGLERLDGAMQRLREIRPSLPQTGIDIEVEIGLNLGWASWLVGMPDQALRRALEASEIAIERKDPNSRTLALVYLFNVHYLRGEYRLAADCARELQGLGDDFELYMPKRTGLILEGAALMEEDSLEEAMQRLLASGASESSAGLEQVVRTFYLGRLALACARVGQPQQGLTLVHEALTRIQGNGFATSEAEIRRIEGELILRLDPSTMAPGEPERLADDCFARAIDTANRQRARSWELRAVTSRARLWLRLGRSGEARSLLRSVYDTFTEGHATADLRAAASLLEELN